MMIKGIERRGYLMMMLVALLFSTMLAAQPREQRSAAEVEMALKRLGTLGSVLYIAAHPDDENTRLITYFSKEKQLRTAYLSLTRGDGGQNLIGEERGAEMGVIRTHELLEARKLDGGEQFFTRAVDFGYSKSPEESFKVWDKQKVLADVVWVIRKFRPDVIVTRFPPNEYAGHGHHTASAMLAEEAFELAADKNAFPEQLKYVKTWAPKRVLWNTSTWWDKSLANIGATDERAEKLATIDVGGYNSSLGKSYTEIASASRSMHKSQGFGSSRSVGENIEYLLHSKGENGFGNLFRDVDLTWNRVEGGEEIAHLVSQLDFNTYRIAPEQFVNELIFLHERISKLPQSHYVNLKKQEVEQLIIDCTGLWLEATSEDYEASTGENVKVTLMLINRSNIPVKVEAVDVNGVNQEPGETLQRNKPFSYELNVEVPEGPLGHPYWLMGAFKGTFETKDQEMIGRPKGDPALLAQFALTVNGKMIYLKHPVYYKWTDRVDGELYRPFIIVPEVTATFSESMLIFPNQESQEISVLVKGHKAGVSGKVKLELPPSWKANPAFANFSMKEKGQEQTIKFQVYPSQHSGTGEIKAMVESGGKTSTRGYVEISYPHLPTLTLLPENSIKAVRTEIIIRPGKIVYIKGAGDEVPQGLMQMGYEVEVVSAADIRELDLKSYQAVICGIRVYNTDKVMKQVQPLLMEYVKQGGNMIVQYNTNRGLHTEDLGPYPFELSRKRVTVEDAPATFIDPAHPLLNTPNKITQADFQGWVQERGLYFASEWDDKYQPVIAWNDPEEEPQKGALLMAEYGEGRYIYTGISFFRELPAGVPGAYRLFANIVSCGK